MESRAKEGTGARVAAKRNSQARLNSMLVGRTFKIKVGHSSQLSMTSKTTILLQYATNKTTASKNNIEEINLGGRQ